MTDVAKALLRALREQSERERARMLLDRKTDAARELLRALRGGR